LISDDLDEKTWSQLASEIRQWHHFFGAAAFATPWKELVYPYGWKQRKRINILVFCLRHCKCDVNENVESRCTTHS